MSLQLSKERKVMQLAETTIVKPRFIEALGCEGLSNFDIAKSTGRNVFHINQMIKRPTFQRLARNNNYNFITAVIKLGKVGRPERHIYMPTRAAKALIATGDWPECHKYLEFLFDCEEVATQIVPRLLAEREDLKHRILQLEASQQRSLPKPKQALVPKWHPTLWGPPEIVGYELVDADKADSYDKAVAKVMQCNRVVKGLSKAIEVEWRKIERGKS
jgi:hypothetical protein